MKNADEAINVARDYKAVLEEAVTQFGEMQSQFEESLRLIEKIQLENACQRQELEITRKLNEALRSRKHDQKALQAAILERCNVAIDLEELQQAMQDARVSA